MKSNAQLRHEGQGNVPPPPSVPVDTSVAASSSQAVPPSFNIEVAFAQLMSSMGAFQQEVNLIGERIEQSQINIRKCLKYHHPKPNDDDDRVFLLFFMFLLLFGVITFSPINYQPLSTCPHELTHRPKESIQLPTLHTLPHSVKEFR
jgi:hypothetical protein